MVHVAARRIGVVQLRFDPDPPVGGSVLTEEETLQTAEYVYGLEIRVNEDLSRNLVITDHGGGIRVYEE